MRSCLWPLFYSFSCLLVSISANTVIQLDDTNIDALFKNNELVFVNFYADWCRFSQMLAPVFAEGSDLIAKDFPAGNGKIAFAKVDCDRQTAIAQKYKVNKYPTLKLFVYGEPIKREYRGQRSAEAFDKFIRDQLASPIVKKETFEEMDAISDEKRNMLIYIADESSNNYKNVLKAASQLKSDCNWYVMSGPAAEPYRKDGEDVIYFRQPMRESSDVPFTGLTMADSLTEWARDLCVPRVRVLTFENAEELTEEGIPFLILFHHPDDHETPAKFLEQVNYQLSNDRDTVNALTADGIKFAHPLHHLGKSANDLPLIAIDSFKHMYLFKHDVKTNLGDEGLLKQFVDDLQSGKLHREFHYGPDPVTQATKPQVAGQENVNRGGAPAPPPKTKDPTSPPESIFKQLKPSHNRYTVLKDEL
ncbi:endoplasmic reticulum resident protein 44-like [Watersipora subatra]|uniref:endoplasmic reticulum resident protein 44-like n=1 Tax=Watersipora subatra TaxID=2589382 RepID=UPI00355BB328